MKTINRSSILLTLMMLLLVLLPVATGVLGFIEDDDFTDQDDFFTASSFNVTWARILTHQMLPGLIFGMSIFTLFVVYLGGRSNHRRFNDRTIAAINSLGGSFFATALIKRAVFVFFFPVPFPIHVERQLNSCFIPTIIPSPKEVL